MLQAWFTLLDAGLGPALGREMARFTGGQHTNQSIWNLLKSVERIAVVIAAALVIVLWLSSGWISEQWLVAEGLSQKTVASAVGLMGLVAALRVLEGVYRSALLGLQKQVIYNYLLVATSTLKSVGAVAVVALVKPSIEAFFLWQAFASILAVFALAATSRRVLPKAYRAVEFSWVEISRVWTYAKGMLLITILSLMLMQVDKLVLSSVLPLAEFGVYSLAATVAMALLVLVTPISQAWFPRLSQLQALGCSLEMNRVFHVGAQLVTVILGSAAVVLFLFAERVLALWTQNTELAAQAAPLLAVLILGNVLNGFMWMPYQAQLAHGWTSLSVKINLLAVAVLTPTTVWVAHNYGPFEVCLIWLFLNASYVVFGGKLTFNKIMRGEFRRWVVDDLCKPMTAILITAVTFKLTAPPNLEPVIEILFIAVASIVTLTASAMSAPLIRQLFIKRMF